MSRIRWCTPKLHSRVVETSSLEWQITLLFVFGNLMDESRFGGCQENCVWLLCAKGQSVKFGARGIMVWIFLSFFLGVWLGPLVPVKIIFNAKAYQDILERLPRSYSFYSCKGWAKNKKKKKKVKESGFYKHENHKLRDSVYIWIHVVN